MPKNGSPMTKELAAAHLSGVLNEVRKQPNTGWQDVCVALEAEMSHLSGEGVWITAFTIELYADALVVKILNAAPKKPKDYNFRGIWAVLYAMMMPRVLPIEADPFRVASITISHKKDPVVTYDRSYKVGLPISLSEEYDVEAFKRIIKPSAPGAGNPAGLGQ